MAAASTSPFSSSFLAQIKQALEEQRTRLTTELAGVAAPGGKNGAFSADFPEFGDKEDENAKEIEQYTTNKPLEMTLEKELVDIEKSLERLTKNTYGICKYCHNAIDEKRLLARPTSSSCVSCKKTLTNEY